MLRKRTVSKEIDRLIKLVGDVKEIRLGGEFFNQFIYENRLPQKQYDVGDRVLYKKAIPVIKIVRSKIEIK